ncbi:MAG TPA: MBL fold metallo-hydrolase [Firmicutes bacterium]|nr:MBL fold metallo-hydrolase [Bacillota bacterium]
MEVHSLPVGLIQTNCYLFEGADHIAAVVDPGAQGDRILALARENGMDIRYILLTHGHFDHVCAANAIQQATGAEIIIGANDEHMLARPMTKSGLKAPGYNDDPVVPDRSVKEGDILDIGGIRLHVLETPGHTPGGVTYRTEDGILFTGDTLFKGSIGRTDLPGGDQATIMKSLQKLAALKGDFLVYPGHGPSTTLAHERQTNPFMGEYYDSFD